MSSSAGHKAMRLEDNPGALWLPEGGETMEEKEVIRRARKGRPAIAEEARRSHRVTVGFNDVEYKALESMHRKCPDETRQGIIRKAVQGIRPVSVIGKEQWQSLSRPLSNLNQLAHHMNSGKIPDTDDLKACLKDTEKSIREVREALRKDGEDDTEHN